MFFLFVGTLLFAQNLHATLEYIIDEKKKRLAPRLYLHLKTESVGDERCMNV